MWNNAWYPPWLQSRQLRKTKRPKCRFKSNFEWLPYDHTPARNVQQFQFAIMLGISNARQCHYSCSAWNETTKGYRKRLFNNRTCALSRLVTYEASSKSIVANVVYVAWSRFSNIRIGSLAQDKQLKSMFASFIESQEESCIPFWNRFNRLINRSKTKRMILFETNVAIPINNIGDK